MSSSGPSLVLRKLLGEELLRCKRKFGGKGEENGKNGETSPAGEDKNEPAEEDSEEFEEERVPVSVVFETAEGAGEGGVCGGGEGDGGGGGASEGGGDKVLGLYFCSSWCPPCTNFRPQLEAFYRNVRKGWWEKNFEMIAVSTDEEEEGFRMTFRGSPWFALPFRDRERKARLRRRYRVRGVPTLVLVDAETGRAITGAGRDHVLHDPEATGFPWQPRSLVTVLSEGALVDRDGRRHNYHLPAEDEDENEEGLVHGLYFSANWCPPCKAFTPQLAETYRRVRERGHKFEVTFISSDRSEESFSLYHSTMPWAAVPFEEESRRRELATVLGVQGIPTLVLLDAKGKVITDEGRVEVNEDPEGLNFPWHPRLVNTLTERHASILSDYPAVILFVEGEDSEIEFAESVLMPAAEEYKSKHREDDEICLQFFIGCDSEPIDTLREYVGIDDAVPLLTVIDMAARKVCVMEDGAEITEESVKAFVNKFLIGGLPVADIRDSPSPYEQQPVIVPQQPNSKSVPASALMRADQEV